jgi:hypothetical protein
MQEMNDNIKDPQHYRYPFGDFIDVIQQTVDDFGSVCQANILKYGIRANKKYESPKDDIQKIIRYGEFWLNHLDGKPASSPRVEEIATIDKLKDMLNKQEQELIQDKKIKCVVINNEEIPEHIAQDIIRELWRLADEKQKI